MIALLALRKIKILVNYGAHENTSVFRSKPKSERLFLRFYSLHNLVPHETENKNISEARLVSLTS